MFRIGSASTATPLLAAARWTQCAAALRALKHPRCSNHGWRLKERALLRYSGAPFRYAASSRNYTGRKFMHVLARRSASTMLAFAFCATGASAQGWQHLGAVQRVENLKDGVELTAGRAKVRITAFNDTIVRGRVAPQGNFQKDSSWTVIAAPQSPTVKVEDSTNALKLTPATITLLVPQSPLLTPSPAPPPL